MVCSLMNKRMKMRQSSGETMLSGPHCLLRGTRDEAKTHENIVQSERNRTNRGCSSLRTLTVCSKAIPLLPVRTMHVGSCDKRYLTLPKKLTVLFSVAFRSFNIVSRWLTPNPSSYLSASNRAVLSTCLICRPLS